MCDCNAPSLGTDNSEYGNRLRNQIAEEHVIRQDFIKCFNLAQRMDVMYPTLPGAFIGSVSERLERVFNHMVSLIEDEYDSNSHS